MSLTPSRLAAILCLGAMTTVDVVAQTTSLEEILVTARRRSESMQDIPIAVSAISGEDLLSKGISNTAELSKSVPSLEIRKGQANQIYIRGVGERTGFARVDPAVGVYLDDLFLPRSDGQLLDTIDIRSIQVLRGPQGTLFGKNTTGGAMVVNLVKPDDSNDSYIDVGIGNYGQNHLKAGINIPISDTFFTRAAVNITRDDGYFKNIAQNSYTNSNDRQAILFQTRWEASEALSLDTQFFYGKTREGFPGTNCSIPTKKSLYYEGLWVAHPGDTDPSNLTAFEENCARNSRERLGDLKSDAGPNPRLTKDLDTFLFGATGEWQVNDDLTFKAVIGLRDEKEGPILASDPDGGPALWSSYVNTEDSDRGSYSLELQLNGDAFDQRLRYTAGLFVMQETSTENFSTSNVIRGIDAQTLAEIAAGSAPTRPLPGGTVPLVGFIGLPLTVSDFDLENNSAALFAQASFDITKQLELTVGYRITEEERNATLGVMDADLEAIGMRLTQTGLFGAPQSQGVFGPGLEGFFPFLGPLGWRSDPVGFAASQFGDANRDGLIDYPMDPNSFRTDKRSETFSESTPMVSLSYSVPEQWLNNSVIDSTMLYATWSIGFKSGFFEPRGVDGMQRVEPETVTNHEIGFKVDAFDHTLRVNAAFYSMDFENQQLIAVGADSGDNVVVVFGNAGESEINGAELEVNWLPLDDLMINANLSINNYRYTEFMDQDLQSQIVGEVRAIDRTNETFPVSPDKSASMGIQYSFRGSFGTVTPRLDASYKSDIFYGFDPGSYSAFKRDTNSAGQSAYTLLDARLSWQNSDGNTTVTAWVKNLNDERYRIGAVAVADSSGVYNQVWGEPRMFGLDLRHAY